MLPLSWDSPSARGSWGDVESGHSEGITSLPWPVPTGNQPLLQQGKGRLIKLRFNLNSFSLTSGHWILGNGDYLAHMGSGFRGCFHKLTHLDLRCPAVDQRSLIPAMETLDLVQIHPLVQIHSTALWHTLILGTFFAKSRAVCQLQIDIMWPANSELEHITSCARANSAKMCLCLIQIESVLPRKKPQSTADVILIDVQPQPEPLPLPKHLQRGGKQCWEEASCRDSTSALVSLCELPRAYINFKESTLA